ncbi:DedA family protein [Dyadobacter sp. 32]|uniref:DedA family protein n=1 Tax=Dyadobacter sp. 32 TaxID=538966 RepID=UPI0011EF4259
MDSIIGFFQYILNSEDLIRTGGLLVITFIVFAENGLFFAFFLPGDYLVFLAGVFCGTGILDVPILILLISLFTAAVLGSLVGYIFGKYFGDMFENRKDSFFFKKKHIETTRTYFEKYGSRTLIISRFLPIVRTFAPILAGLVRMSFPSFLINNVVGGTIWIGTLTGGGFLFGERFPGIVDYVQYIIMFFLAITTFTVIKGYLSARKEMNP